MQQKRHSFALSKRLTAHSFVVITGVAALLHNSACYAFVPAAHWQSTRTRTHVQSHLLAPKQGSFPAVCWSRKPVLPKVGGLQPLACEGGTSDEREEKRSKYESLYKELLIKASKLPPGPSKTSYIAKARNAKAMADALAYKKPQAEGSHDEGEPPAAAPEPQTITPTAQAATPTAQAEATPRKPPLEIDIIPASRFILDELTDIVNWAYRGKRGREGWTGEMKYLEGIRIAKEDMEKLLEQTEDDDNKLRVFVAVSTSGPAVGSIKVEPSGKGEAELGMFAVDPDFQSSGVGTKLLNEAENYAKKKLGANKIVMYVLDVREELLEWYSKKGYIRTGQFVPFPTDANVGKPKMELRFERLEKTM